MVASLLVEVLPASGFCVLGNEVWHYAILFFVLAIACWATVCYDLQF